MKRRGKILIVGVSGLVLIVAGLFGGLNSFARLQVRQAVTSGDGDQLAWWLKVGGDVNATDAQGDTLLHQSVRRRQLRVAMRLIDEGAKVDALDRHLQTPLHLAVLDGNAPLTRLLIAAGADPALRYPRGATPLVMAAELGHIEVATALLEAGASLHEKAGRNQWTALHAAAKQCDAEMTRQLLKRGAKLDITDILDRTPVHVAAEDFRTDALQVLLEHGAAVEPASGSASPLMIAARNGRLDTVRLLLKHGADPQRATPEGLTPLDAAVQSGNAHVVKLFLSKGDGRRFSKALFAAARTDNSELIELLIAEGADPYLKTDDGQTLLHIAAEEGNLPLVKALVAKNLPVDAQNARGATPLHAAARFAKAEVVRFLLQHGSNANLGCGACGTPLHATILGALERKSAEHLTVLDTLLASAIDVNAVNREEQTALRIAVEYNLEPLVDRLAASGAQLFSAEVGD